jgi:hypothetical protein
MFFRPQLLFILVLASATVAPEELRSTLHEIESSFESPTQHAVRRLEVVAEAEDEDIAGAALALLGDAHRVGSGSVEANATSALSYYRKSAQKVTVFTSVYFLFSRLSHCAP